MHKAVRYAQLLHRAFGWRGLARRSVYVARLRTGELARRLPARADFTESPHVMWTHRFDLDAIRQRYEAEGIAETVRQQVVYEAERVLAGQLQLYGDRWHDVGWPPRWHRNVFTGYEYPRAHWTAISDNDPERGDIKDVWELSRLPFTYLFARAHVLTGDDRYVEAWWQAIEDWAHHNPPNLGVNWHCGQETSLRAITLCFGLSVFADHPASTTARLDLAARILGASVDRVRPTVGYALSQRNNHAVSELVFLLTVDNTNDRQLLRHLLEVLDDQFYPDGSYSQQSFTYQRLAVQALQWLLVTRPDLPPRARSRVVEVLARSRDFLSRCSDPVSGWLPNYGPNDGALLLHLTTAHYRDFRPLLTSLGAPGDPERREPSLWLSIPEVAEQKTDANEQPTTYHTLRGPRSLAFTRIGTGRHRPGHADQQALDLWIDGSNVVPDPGTFRYTAPTPWGNPFTGAEVHAAPRADESAALTLGRFLRDAGPAAEQVHRSQSAEVDVLISRRPAGDGALWRAIVRRGDSYAVVDAAEGVDARIRWNFQDIADLGAIWIAGDRSAILQPQPSEDDPVSGWASPLYGAREQVEARDVDVPADTVSAATFTPEGEQALDRDEQMAELSTWLPAWAVAAFKGSDVAA